MKSKFKIILLTMFFLLSFNVIAFAETYPKPPSDFQYYLVFSYYGNTHVVLSSKPCTKNTEMIAPLGGNYRSYKLVNGTWQEPSKIFVGSEYCGVARPENATLLSSNYDVLDSKGNVFFQNPSVWSNLKLGGMILEIRKIAIIAVCLIVSLVAFRKGWTLLRNSLRGL